jgi:hypothetical protein
MELSDFRGVMRAAAISALNAPAPRYFLLLAGIVAVTATLSSEWPKITGPNLLTPLHQRKRLNNQAV